jgi:hypothetical protein
VSEVRLNSWTSDAISPGLCIRIELPLTAQDHTREGDYVWRSGTY